MEDSEIAACVAEVAGCRADGALIEPLGGRQGLLVARVMLSGRSYIFKAVRESARKELCLARFVGELAAAPAVLGGEEDLRRGLYWIVLEDLGDCRLTDSPIADDYCRAAQALARLQVRCLDASLELSDFGLRVVDSSDWENIALRLIEIGDDGVLPIWDLETISWSTTDLARDASTIPCTLIHGDLHAGNVALSAESALLMDWGSAYLAPAFIGLEEMLWPAAAWLRREELDRVKAAYLREWAPTLGKPGPLERAVLACRTLLRLQTMQSTLESEDQFAARAVYRRLKESWDAWRRS